MAGFWIKKVIAKSETKEAADVTFEQGLNVIQGRSDTGKTCIVKCIEFVFGGSMKTLTTPFKPSAGYNEAIVILASDKGDITVSRKVGKNQVEVSTQIEGIESGTYNLKHSEKSKTPDFNIIMLHLLGISGEPKVPANARFKPERLTWTNLLRLFYVNERRIDDEVSIIEPQETYEKTLFMSSLIYLLTGQDFSEMDVQTQKEIRKARKEAVEEYVNGKLSNAGERKERLEKELQIFGGIDIEAQIAQMISSLEETEHKIAAALEESKKLLSSIMALEEKSAECNVLLSRYQNLRSQYKADIQRLSFIVEGEVETKKLPQVTSCPFCEGKITPHSHKSYIETSKAELGRIMSQMQGLVETEKDVKAQQAKIQEELDEQRKKRSNIEAMIEQELKPESAKLTESINGYRAYIQINKEMQIVAEFAKDWSGDLDELAIKEQEEKDMEQIQYHPKEHFDSQFQTTMSEYADSILQECQYQGLAAARFDMKKFDIEVNGEPKGASHGKGYCSYLNTVVALMFRKYLNEHAIYNPELLIIDTPLHGFDEDDSEDAPESMKAGLFNYFINHQEGQLIVIENLDHIPHLDFAASGANVITFTKRKVDGERYGFLHDVY
ncbi:AAA family ATPase [Anaeromicropila populeti]|uniref:AAA domain-containing protein n=1 Tax=Anaeromicropila populeti TaxID=37658 RepID=A0A1I6LXS1_9FIRM|nr:AAA family ATPase [Anaeromicropila populeti]SFS08271.1 AAA domain-containing protein [Anaeromicropila populeti]